MSIGTKRLHLLVEKNLVGEMVSIVPLEQHATAAATTMSTGAAWHLRLVGQSRHVGRMALCVASGQRATNAATAGHGNIFGLFVALNLCV